ncbi:MAG: hypothetical protein AAGI17_03715 [Planctomycetota bacterium]
MDEPITESQSVPVPQPRQRGAMTPDDRFAAVMASEQAARRNQPRGAIIAGVLVLVAALGFLLVARADHTQASRDLAGARGKLRRVADTLGEIEYFRRLSQQDAPVGDVVIASGESPLSQIERLGIQARLEESIGIVQARTNVVDEDRGILKATYPYTVNDRSLPNLLEWVRLVTERVEGMEVDGIELTPQRDLRWQMRVTFGRYEER